MVVGALMGLLVMSRKFKESVDLGVVNQGELITTAASFELSTMKDFEEFWKVSRLRGRLSLMKNESF